MRYIMKTKFELILEQWAGPAQTDAFEAYVRVLNKTVIQSLVWRVHDRPAPDNAPKILDEVTGKAGLKILSGDKAKELAQAVLLACRSCSSLRDFFVQIEKSTAYIGNMSVDLGAECNTDAAYSVEAMLPWAKQKPLPDLLIGERTIKYQSTSRHAPNWFILHGL